MLQSVQQKALELERPDMVQAALRHGAPAKQIDLLTLYKKLEDPEQCKYASSTSLITWKPNPPAAAERQKKSGPGLGICSRQSTCSSLTSSSDSNSVNRGHARPCSLVAPQSLQPLYPAEGGQEARDDRCP